jgi:hypothetical protein
MLESVRYTIIPELIEIFGVESLSKLISRFGGFNISVPSVTFFETVSRKVDIFETLRVKDSPEITHMLADRHGITLDQVRDLYLEVKKTRKKYGVDL